jgi:hypothetical protein
MARMSCRPCQHLTSAPEGGELSREIAEQARINALGGIKNLDNIRNPIGKARLFLMP